MTGAIVVAVDGGGTRSRARIYDAAGAVLGEGADGTGNIRIGLDEAFANINAAIGAALAQAGLAAAALADAHLVLGLAGIVDAADAQFAVAAAPRTARTTAVSDAHIACLGAFAGGDGAILISGTGSAAHAIVDGQGHALFGWGFQVDDRGSAAALGRAAVVATLEAHDGLAPDTPLTRAVQQRVGAQVGAIVSWIGAARPRDYGALAPLVFDAAEAGDAVGIRLLRQSGSELDRMVARLREVGAPSICLMGGMASAIRPWLAASTRASLTPARSDALTGAWLLARQTEMVRDQ